MGGDGMPCPKCGHDYEDQENDQDCDDCWSQAIINKMLRDMRDDNGNIAWDENGDPIELWCRGYAGLAVMERLRRMGIK